MFEQQGSLKYDCVIVGGGLAGGLLLAALKHNQPALRILLLESQDQLGGNHTWCFHSTDLPNHSEWVRPFISKTWRRQKVAFPEYERFLEQEYNAICSEDFSKALLKQFSDSISLNTSVSSISAKEIICSNGQVLSAEYIVDARGWLPVSDSKSQGYQKFLGLDVRLRRPHGLDYVFLKDARVPQTDGYRFFYLLPWSEDRLLVEDTYYSNGPDLDPEKIQLQILNYIKAQGWEIESIERVEQGCLALPYLESKVESSEDVIRLGASSGIFQPVTGYTFPVTVAKANLLASLPLAQWSQAIRDFDQEARSRYRFLLYLNRMLFLAAQPSQRYQVLQRFYRLPEELIARFYKGDLRASDYARILIGKPPVSIIKAVRLLLTSRDFRG